MPQMDKSQLQSHNPWWLRPELILEDSKILEFEKQKFQWQPKIFKKKELNKDVIFTLRGPRQVGKTTFIKLLIKKLLLKDKHTKEAIFYFACDRIADFNELYNLIKSYLDFIRPRTNKRIFIFLDEISFVKDWQRAIKQLKDQGKLKKAVLILTGSNTLDLKYSSERMPGRRGEASKLDREILPLNFKEYLELIQKDLIELSSQELSQLHLPKLKKLFEDYLLTGGFIANVNEFHQKKYISPIRFEVYSSWIEGDLHKIGKSEKTLLRLSEQIEKHLTSSVSFYKLAKETGLASYATIEDYVDILEKMFVLIRLDYFDISQKKPDYKKNHKFYFSDPFVLYTLLSKTKGFLDDPFNFSKREFITREKQPIWSELSVVSLFSRLYPQIYYGKIGDREIDLVARKEGKYIFCEVKYQEKASLQDFHWIDQAISKKEKLIVITKQDFAVGKNRVLVPREVFLVKYNDFLK